MFVEPTVLERSVAVIRAGSWSACGFDLGASTRSQGPAARHNGLMTSAAMRVLTIAATLAVVAGLALGSLIGDIKLALTAGLATVAVAGGWIVALRVPRSAVAPALAWTGAAVVVVLANDVVAASASSSSPLPFAEVARHWWVGLWPVNLAGLVALLLVFPNGRRPGWIGRTVPWLFVIATVVTIAGQWGLTQDGGQVVTDTRPAVVVFAGPLLVAVCLVTTVVDIVACYRASGFRVRHQMKWLVVSGGLVVVLLFAGWAMQALGLPVVTSYAPFLFATVVAVPASVVIAIVRYDVLDVDRILSASLAWLITLLVSATIFAGVVVAVSGLMAQYSALSTAAAAFATALALLPSHRLINSFVGRLVDRDRYVAVAMVERFAADVRAGRREPEEIEGVLREAQHDDDLTVLLARPDGSWMRIDGTAADPIESSHHLDLRAQDDVIARLVLGWSSARARSRLAALVRPAYVPIEVSRLRLALRAALEESRESRARLSSATADERRRIERDLHDGIQQRIIATGMRLRSVQNRVGPAEADDLDRAVQELLGTVDELRRLAHGVRPGRLDDGLAAALAALNESAPVPVEVKVGELPEIDEARAATAYFVASEATANALKHAQATLILVEVTSDNGMLALSISDDGIGLPPTADLFHLRDRVRSVGGELAFTSTPGSGTTVSAVI